MKSVALIGTGRIANVHARHLRGTGVERLTVCDQDRARAEAFAAKWEATVADTMDAAIERADLVAALVPSPAHREVLERIVAAGKPAFVEKPLALTVEDADALVALAQEKRAFVAVGHVVRFFPGYAEAAARIRAGALGDVAVVRLKRGGGTVPEGEWYADHARSGGVLIDLAIHDFDWLLWTCGPAVRVHARSVGASTGEGPDHALATVTMASGALAHVESTWMTPGPFRTAFEVAGSQGLVEYDSRDAVSVRTATTAELPMGSDEDPYARHWRAISAALAAEAPPPVPPSEAAAALRLAHAALRSARSGEVVEL